MSIDMIILGVGALGLAGLVVGLIGPRRNNFPKHPHAHGDARFASPEEAKEAMKGAGGRTLEIDETEF